MDDFYPARAAAWQLALAGCGRLREASGYRPGSHTALYPHHVPHTGVHHQPCSGRSNTCGFRQDSRRVEGCRRLYGVGYCWAPFGGRGELKVLAFGFGLAPLSSRVANKILG